MPPSKFREDTTKIEHWQSSMLVQLRTDHLPLQKHPNRIGHVSSPISLACCTADKTMYHYFMVCPTYSTHRKWMESQLRRAAKSISGLPSNPKVFPCLFRFIHNTRCFHNMAMDKQPG